MAVDLFLPNVAVNQPIVNGTNWSTPIFSLNGVVSVFAQIVAVNGCAGTLYLQPTNADPLLAPTMYSNGGPITGQQATGTVSANGNQTVCLSSGSNGVAARGFILVFVPSASGNIHITVNLRRTAY